MSIENIIKNFIAQIHMRYPALHIEYEYDEDTNEYDIWHNNSNLEFDDDDFLKYCSDVASELFYKNNIYNFTFGYDHERSKMLENIRISLDLYNDNIEFNIIQKITPKNLSYDINEDLDIRFNSHIKYYQTEKYSEYYSIEKEESFNINQINEDTFFQKLNLKEVA